MSNTSVPASRASTGDFRVGRIFERTTTVYSRNFARFSAVALIAAVPQVLLAIFSGDGFGGIGGYFAAQGTATSVLTVVLIVIVIYGLYLLTQAVLVHSSFQDMRGRAVDLNHSFNVALSRLPAIVGILLLIFGVFFAGAVAVALVGAAASFVVGFFGIFLIVALFIALLAILFTRWFVAIPICVVERAGPLQCLRRSSQLTEGHRWKIFGIILLLYLLIGFIGQLVILAITALGGAVIGHIGNVIWTMVWMAFASIFVVVTYYELRSAKEGIDIEQIASVFD